MGRKGRVSLLVAAAAILGLSAWVIIHPRVPEPVAKGKPLSHWLAQLDQGTNYNHEARVEAEAAVRQIGTNAIPILLQMLRTKDSPLKTKVLSWVSKHSLGKYRYLRPEMIRTRAALGFQALGPLAAGVVPELLKILDQAHAFEVASHLTLRMPEDDAVAYLKHNGISNKFGARLGSSFGWNHFLTLGNDCSLVLDIHPAAFRPDGAWADGIVRAAFISAYGAHVITIPLTNATAPQK